ncbi:MAG: DUF4230 domain-containing protein [Gemmatimonadales bacterium]
MPDSTPRRPQWPLLMALLLFGLAVVVGRSVSHERGRLQRLTSGETTVSQAVVVEQTRAVARLVTSETVLRDVITYENRRLGSTKRSLVVATGKVLTGFDLDRGMEVTVDHPSRRIRITLPPPAVMGVEITELKTYDEHRGLWNPFSPSDRDTIFSLARRQLVAAAGEVELARHAEESARRLLEATVRAEGYTTEVRFADRPARPAGDTAAMRER